MTALVEEQSDSEQEEQLGAEIDIDSDEELQEAFAAGLIKPGLNTLFEQRKKRTAINDKAALEQKLKELKPKDKSLNSWIERLDMINKPAPLAPELAMKEEELKKKRAKMMGNQNVPEVENEFQRETLFYRQAQSAALEGLARLKSMNIPTKRPDDYFAQMAKSDEHMQKIRQKIVSKQLTAERIEKVRKLRDLKKFGKKVQIEVQQKRQKEKKDMLDQVKKFRKGQAGSEGLDFLDDTNEPDYSEGPKVSNKKKGGQQQQGGRNLQNPAVKKAIDMKRKGKDKKFGFGGKKKGLKSNTKSSVNDVDGYRRPKAPGMAKKLNAKRLGKGRRMKQKGKKGGGGKK